MAAAGSDMKRVHISGDTYYVPGITNVCLYRDYMIDPSNNENVDWDHPPEVKYALVSHLHTDHFWNGAKMRAAGAKVYAPRCERSAIENTDINVNGNFCWAVPPEGMRPWYFTSVSCPVDGAIDELDMPLKVVPLPGHTQWQVGFLTPDNVLAAADAIVTKKVWDTKRIVYYTSPDDARRSLEYIRDCGADYVIPSHCSLLSKDEAAELAEVNLKGIDMLEEAVLKVLGREERTTEEMVSGTGCALKIRDDFTMNIVVETTVRAFLFMLSRQNRVRYQLRQHKVYWQAVS